MIHPSMSRRAFGKQLGMTTAAAAIGSAIVNADDRTAADVNSNSEHAQDASLLRGTAEHVISIWLGGGMGQIDTFDPKRLGDPKAKKAGSYYGDRYSGPRRAGLRAFGDVSQADGAGYRSSHGSS